MNVIAKSILKRDNNKYALVIFDKLNRASFIIKLDNLDIDESARDILLDPATRGDQK